MACDTEVRVVSMTAAGTHQRCDCGRTSITLLSEGTLDLGNGTEGGGVTLERVPATPELKLVPPPEDAA